MVLADTSRPLEEHAVVRASARRPGWHGSGSGSLGRNRTGQEKHDRPILVCGVAGSCPHRCGLRKCRGGEDVRPHACDVRGSCPPECVRRLLVGRRAVRPRFAARCPMLADRVEGSGGQRGAHRSPSGHRSDPGHRVHASRYRTERRLDRGAAARGPEPRGPRSLHGDDQLHRAPGRPHRRRPDRHRGRHRGRGHGRRRHRRPAEPSDRRGRGHGRDAQRSQRLEQEQANLRPFRSHRQGSVGKRRSRAAAHAHDFRTFWLADLRDPARDGALARERARLEQPARRHGRRHGRTRHGHHVRPANLLAGGRRRAGVRQRDPHQLRVGDPRRRGEPRRWRPRGDVRLVGGFLHRQDAVAGAARRLRPAAGGHRRRTLCHDVPQRRRRRGDRARSGGWNPDLLVVERQPGCDRLTRQRRAPGRERPASDSSRDRDARERRHSVRPGRESHPHDQRRWLHRAIDCGGDVQRRRPPADHGSRERERRDER